MSLFLFFFVCLFFNIKSFHFLDSTVKWKQTVFVFVWFTSLSITPCRFIHVVANAMIHFFKKVSEDIFTCGLPRWLRVKDPPTNAGDVGDRVWSLGGENPLKEEMATYSSILDWEIPKTEELGRLQSMGSQRFGCNWANMHARNIQSYATSFLIHQLLET